MQVALNAITLNEAYLKQARAAWLPTVQADVSASTTRPSQNRLNGLKLADFVGTNHIEDYTAAMGVSGEVDIWGKIRQKKQASLDSNLDRKSVESGKRGTERVTPGG